MPVGEVEIGVLQKRGGREQDVGEVGGVGLELLEYDCEQVGTAQSLPHQVLIRSDGGWIRVVDQHGLDGRLVQIRERLAELGHIDDAGFATQRRLKLQVRHLETRLVQVKGVTGGKLQPATDIAPGSCQGWQSRDGAHRIAAALATLNTVIDPNGRGLGLRVLSGELDDVVPIETCQGFRSLRRIAGRQTP